MQVASNIYSKPTITFLPRDEQTKAKVLDYCMWVLAWAVFMQVMFVYHNQLIGTLVQYQHNIRSIFFPMCMPMIRCFGN